MNANFGRLIIFAQDAIKKTRLLLTDVRNALIAEKKADKDTTIGVCKAIWRKSGESRRNTEINAKKKGYKLGYAHIVGKIRQCKDFCGVNLVKRNEAIGIRRVTLRLMVVM
jgi:hypothetical protein